MTATRLKATAKRAPKPAFANNSNRCFGCGSLHQMSELVPKRVKQMTAVPFDARWKPRRREVTYRIGKQGVSAFLLLGADDLAALRTIDRPSHPGHTA